MRGLRWSGMAGQVRREWQRAVHLFQYRLPLGRIGKPRCKRGFGHALGKRLAENLGKSGRFHECRSFLKRWRRAVDRWLNRVNAGNAFSSPADGTHLPIRLATCRPPTAPCSANPIRSLPISISSPSNARSPPRPRNKRSTLEARLQSLLGHSSVEPSGAR